MTVSNILRKEASPEVEGGRLAAAMKSTNSLVDGSLDGEGQEASLVED